MTSMTNGTGNQASNRIEPVMNVGKQCALYLGIVAALAAGVAFFGPFEREKAIAQEESGVALEGDLTRLPPMEAPDDAPKDIAVFYVTGAAAEKMWSAMPMEPVADECVGRQSKYGNGIICYGANNDGSPAENKF